VFLEPLSNSSRLRRLSHRAWHGARSQHRDTHRRGLQHNDLASRLDHGIGSSMGKFLDHLLLFGLQIAHVDFTWPGYGSTSWSSFVVFHFTTFPAEVSPLYWDGERRQWFFLKGLFSERMSYVASTGSPARQSGQVAEKMCHSPRRSKPRMGGFTIFVPFLLK